jgi:hypothetical protein
VARLLEGKPKTQDVPRQVLSDCHSYHNVAIHFDQGFELSSTLVNQEGLPVLALGCGRGEALKYRKLLK